MDLPQAISLALIQAVTEFLPVSSSAHLILLPTLVGWRDQGLAFDVAVHLGTVCAVVFHYRAGLVRALRNLDRPSTDGTLLAFAAVATLPALVFGGVFSGDIERHLRTPLVIGSTSIGFGLLLWVAVWRASRRSVSAEKPLSWQLAVIIGCAQALALIPGTSRTGVVITAGLLLGLSRAAAIRFSFVLAAPIILAASLHQAAQITARPEGAALLTLALGFVVAAVVALTTIRLFLRLVEVIGLVPFILYRLVLGALLFLLPP